MEKLKQYLAQTETTQASLADLIGVSRSHMNELVSGAKKPSLNVAIKIENATCGKIAASEWTHDVRVKP